MCTQPVQIFTDNAGFMDQPAVVIQHRHNCPRVDGKERLGKLFAFRQVDMPALPVQLLFVKNKSRP